MVWLKVDWNWLLCSDVFLNFQFCDPSMSSRTAKKTRSSSLSLPKSTELVALAFDLSSPKDATLFPQYSIGLHAWF
ncbi:MAG: hypothetical protein ACKPH7_18910, partial [Planktothrix sp.]